MEWYYGQNAYFSVNAFLKDVTDFIVQGTQRQTINDVIDPTTGQPAIYTVSQRVNGPEATVNGWEIAWQHVFGDSGFGFNANMTLVDTDKPYDRNDISQSGFAVTGLADSANLVASSTSTGSRRASPRTGATSTCCSSVRTRTTPHSVPSRRS